MFDILCEKGFSYFALLGEEDELPKAMLFSEESGKCHIKIYDKRLRSKSLDHDTPVLIGKRFAIHENLSWRFSTEQ